jgi:rRNA maturation protein Nop10
MEDRPTVPIDHEESDSPPHEAFALLANEDRFDIIRRLAEADRTQLPFSALYERSRFDDSGQFNYHLDKLVGPFVRKTDEGYELRHAARIVYRLAVGGLLSDRAEAELATVDETCPHCGTAPLTAVYEGDRFWIRCGDCGRRATVAPFPPRALTTHEADRVPAAFDRYTMGSVVRAAENVCPWCGSPLSASLESAEEGWPTVDRVIRRSCEHCHGWIYMRVHDLLRLHPAVIAFYHERGVDVFGRSFWAVEGVMADGTSVETGGDEWAATVRLAHDGDEIELGLAGDFRASTAEVLATRTGE